MSKQSFFPPFVVKQCKRMMQILLALSNITNEFPRPRYYECEYINRHIYPFDERPTSPMFSAKLLPLAKNAGSRYASLSKCLCEFDVLNECFDASLLKPCSLDKGTFVMPGVAPALEREVNAARGVDTGGGTGRAPSILITFTGCLVD